MRSSLLARRVASVAAAAAIATTGAMTVAGAAGASATHARRLPTHLSIADRRAVEHHKHLTVIEGRLTSFRFPLRGKLVFLDRVTARHKLVIIGREHTGRGGGVAFVVDPKCTSHFALVFPGTPNFHSSHSRVVTVKG
jgi:hypothetical protein